MDDLKGKVVIITGGAGLLGSSYCRACAEAGCKVILVDVDKKGKKLADEIGADFFDTDITSESDVKKLVESVIKKHGKIDALVNNAYPRNKDYGKKFEDVTYDSFCENISMHLGGYFLMAREVSKVMMKQKSGVIINKGSIYGFAAPRFGIYKGTKMTMPVEYAAIKGGVINLTRYLASYLGEYNIRVNCISPGGVFNGQPAELVKSYSKKTVAGKGMLDKNDLAGTLLFLLSDASKHITGQNIVVDDGWSL